MEVTAHRHPALDTRAQSNVRNGDPEAVHRVSSAAAITVPVIVVGEVVVGVSVLRPAGAPQRIRWCSPGFWRNRE